MRRPLTTLIALMTLGLASCGERSEEYDVEVLVPPSKMHGVHGLAFNSKGELHGASLIGQSIYKIDIESGKIETVVGPTHGNADDVEFGPNDMMAWTAGLENSIYTLDKNGEVLTLADNLFGANSINFGPDGKLYVTTIFGGDSLYEIDTTGKNPPREIAKGLGGLNGFEVDADNKLVGPLFLRGKIVEVDLATGDVSDILDGFTRPAAVNLDPDGNIVGVDIETGEVFKINRATKEKSLITKLLPPLDNLAISDEGLIYVSNSAYNGITEVNPETGKTRNIVFGGMSSPGGIELIDQGGKETILLSDTWGNRLIDSTSGSISPLNAETRLSGFSYVAADNERYYMTSIWPLPALQIVNRASGRVEKMIGGFKTPYGIESLDDGRLIVADYGKNELIEISADNKRIKKTLTNDVDGPVGLALANNDEVYVVEYNSGSVSKVTLSTGEKTTIIDDLLEPEDLDVLPNGKLVITETGHDRVIIVDPMTGAREKIIATFVPMGLKGWGGMAAPFLPSGITTDADGAVYVVSDLKNALYKFTPRK